MSRAESYQALATLLEYPQEKEAMLSCLETVTGYLADRSIDSPAEPFAAFVQGSNLAELQENYVATFDFNPGKAPYLGHHLYGDNQKKAAYMIKLKQEYAKFGFAQEGCELPDHLSVLMNFLAHLGRTGEEESRREFIDQAVLPGLKKLTSGGEQSQSSWLPLFEAAELLMKSDCEEASPC